MTKINEARSPDDKNNNSRVEDELSPEEETKNNSSSKPHKKKKKKVKYLPDDGHTIYSMDGLNPNAQKQKEGVELPKEDRRAMIKAAFSVYGPVFLGIIMCFTIVMILIYFWLK